MSNTSNTDLLEAANFHLEFWAGTLWEKLIQHAIDQGDYEELRSLIAQSLNEMYYMEYRPVVRQIEVY